MPTTIYVTNNRQQEVVQRRLLKGEAETFNLDFSGYGDITAVTWTVESGEAALSNTSLDTSTDIATAVITVAQEGVSLIKALATSGNNKIAKYIRIRAEEPELYQSDYGFLRV